jgi:hypothetical protein
MRFFSLEHIEQEDFLAGIFNRYMDALSTLDTMSRPAGPICDLFSDDSKMIEYRLSKAQRLQYLTHLSHSLHSLHGQAHAAIKLLNSYIYDYQYDPLKFAMENRVKLIEKYGNDDDGPELTEDWQYLESYSFVYELRQHFEHEDRPNDELLGTSTKKDFEYFSTLVRNATAFSPFKFFREEGVNVQPHIIKEGKPTAMSLGDEIEFEMNEDLNNDKVAKNFETFIDDAEKMAGIVEKMEVRESNQKEANYLFGMLFKFINP